VPLTTAFRQGTASIARSRRKDSEPSNNGADATLVDQDNLDSKPLCHKLTVKRRITEEKLDGLRPLEIEVRRMLPRESDSAMNLDRLSGYMEVSFRTERLRKRGCDW
jgi:hypothetical protein